MRRNPWLSVAMLATVAVLGVTWAGAASAVDQSHFAKHRTSLAGTWSGRYNGAFTGTFTLHWTQTKSKLHGTIALSNPQGTYGINGSVNGSAISFGAVGAGATYTGSVSGKSMSGSYKSPRGGGKWSAHKTS